MNVNVNVAELVLHMKMMDYAMDVQNFNMWKNKPTEEPMRFRRNQVRNYLVLVLSIRQQIIETYKILGGINYV